VSPDRSAPPVILVVDDDDYVYGAVRAVLRRIHARIVRASTATDGLRLAQTESPAVAILDVGLPDGNGYELAANLRAEPELAGLRIVILTGHAPDASAASASHVDAVLAKPFRLHEFLATVERLLPDAPRSARPIEPSAPDAGR
jgi:DNA-binding response OmpR family regulator